MVNFKVKCENYLLCLICRYEVAPRSDSEDSGSDDEEVNIFPLCIPVCVQAYMINSVCCRQCVWQYLFCLSFYTLALSCL